MKNILEILRLKKQNKFTVLIQRFKVKYRRAVKYAKKHQLGKKLVVLLMGLFFLASAIIPYIL